MYYVIEQVLYKCKVVAQLFGVPNSTVVRLCREGRIPCINLGRLTSPMWRIPLSFIEEAMRGEARWKYPRHFKRQCVKRVTARNRIVQVSREMEKIAQNEKEWGDEDDE